MKTAKQLETEWHAQGKSVRDDLAGFVEFVQRDALELYHKTMEDEAADDTEIRNLARPVLGERDTDGDSFGVPSIVDIVQSLVRRIGKRNEG